MKIKKNQTRVGAKLQQVGGSIKAGVGALVGDDKLEAEGKAAVQHGHVQEETIKAVQRAKGLVEETAGAAKHKLGELLDNQQMEVEGKAKELRGQARQAVNK